MRFGYLASYISCSLDLSDLPPCTADSAGLPHPTWGYLQRLRESFRYLLSPLRSRSRASSSSTAMGESEDFPDADDLGVTSHWALLIAGSAGWGNYRHQSDVAHAYQVCKVIRSKLIISGVLRDHQVSAASVNESTLLYGT